MDLVEIDVVHAEAPQAGIDLRHDRLGIGTRSEQVVAKIIRGGPGELL